jgi:hypothetical protein
VQARLLQEILGNGEVQVKEDPIPYNPEQVQDLIEMLDEWIEKTKENDED